MRILLAGASGAIGLPLVGRLRAAGHEVVAIHRAEGGRERLLTIGATPVQVDVLDREGLLAAVDGHSYDAVISQLTAMKKQPTMHRDMAQTNLLRIEGTANLLDAAERVGARRFLTQSMVFGYGYGDFGDRILDETDPFAPSGGGRFAPHLEAMRVNEQKVLNAAHVEGIALRYGLFYGPGPAGASLVEGLRRRRLPVVRDGGVKPWVHIEDAATATVAALETGVPGSAYNIVDDEPVSFSTLMEATAAAIGAPKPLVVPAWALRAAPYAKAVMTGDLRVANGKAKRELDWELRFPVHRQGVADLAQHFRRPAA